MTRFEPHTVRQQCASTINDKEKRAKFITTWKNGAERRAKGWMGHRDSQSRHLLLLSWIAEIVEYLVATADAMSSSQGPDFPVALDPRWPIFDPFFEPPTYLQQALREVDPQIEPDLTYLKGCHAVHWIYYDELRRCPKCRGKRLEQNGWNPSGPREVHGLRREEMAIGIQLRCLDCADKCRKQGGGSNDDSEGRYCWTTTSADFWENFEHWELPAGLPHFFSRSAVSSDLFDFIVEMRLKSTSAGLAENIRQFHLLEYHKQHLSYLKAFRARTQKQSLTKQTKPLVPYSKPQSKKVGQHTGGYDNRSISDDLITKILLRFCNKTRIKESEEHMRMLSALAISVDTTFRCAYKATLVDKNKARVRSHLGGFVSILNQKSQPISWRLCHSQSQVETQEMLSGLSTRLIGLELPPPEVMTADNCCQIRNTALKVFPNIEVVQDVWHFLMRYLVCIKDGTKNPYRGEVASDIVDAILKAKAANGVPAIYRPQNEQEERLVEAYGKWDEHGGVWTVAATKVHAKQLTHVQKGCLARPRDDIATDGSRIEGSHKGWNSIMRAFASGLEVMNALGHDHVLRHNVRLDMQDDTLDRSMFMYHTHGSHHIHLVNGCTKLWNTLIKSLKRGGPLPANIRPLPELCPAESGEKFGLVKMSTATASQYSLATIKQEPGDETLDLSLPEVLDADQILKEIGVDPALLNAPIPGPALLNAPIPGAAAPNVSVANAPALQAALVSANNSAANTDSKGVKRAHAADVEDDDIVELPPAEWGVPQSWFPSAADTTSGAAIIAASSTSASPGALGVTTIPLDTTSGAPTHGPATIAVSASGVPAITTSPSPAIATSPSPVITTSPASTLAITSSALNVPATTTSNVALTATVSTQATASASASESMASTVAGANAPSAQPVPDGRPPKKKSCLSIAGMPPPLQRKCSSSKPATSSKTTRKQHGVPQSSRGTLDAMLTHLSATTMTVSSMIPSTLTPTNEPCLPNHSIVGLTRSQRLFSVVMQVDPRTLTFGKDASSREFFLFMRLRATYKWATFQMSPYDWVCAASSFNTAIKNLNHEHGLALPLKTPHALLDKLSEVEASIFSRIRENNYRSRNGGTEFWEHHCKAVYLGSKIQRMVDDNSFKVGKTHVCGRCKRIMYPEGKNHKDNHSRKVCSDGVRQTFEKVHLVINGVPRDIVEHPPVFPQPQDVFTNGNIFHPARFMEVVSRFYDRIVINHSAPGALAMTDYAFASLLYDRTVIVPGLDGRPSKVIFKLFHSFDLAPGEAVVLDQHEGERYLRMDCLSEPPLEALQQDAAGGASAGSA